MANCEKLKSLKKEHFYCTKRENFTFHKSNYKYKRRNEMKNDKDTSENDQVNSRFSTNSEDAAKPTTTNTTTSSSSSSTITTNISINKKFHSINELISSITEWQKRLQHTAYEMILGIILLITSSNFNKQRIHRELMQRQYQHPHPHQHAKIGETHDESRSDASDNCRGNSSQQPAANNDISHNNIDDNDELLNMMRQQHHQPVASSDAKNVLATPLIKLTSVRSPLRSSISMATKSTSTLTSTSTLLPSTKMPAMASFICSTANTTLSSPSAPLSLPSSTSTATSTSTISTTISPSSFLSHSTLLKTLPTNDKLFTYLSALFIAFALCARGVAGGACWLSASNTGKCNELYSMNITRAECCGRSMDFSYTERDPSDVEYFFAIAIGGGMECSPCNESCKNVKCAANKKCVKRQGRPKCICAPDCGKANRRRRAKMRAKFYRGHLRQRSEQTQTPRDIRSLSSKITNFNLESVANGSVDVDDHNDEHTDDVVGIVEASNWEKQQRKHNQRNDSKPSQYNEDDGNEQMIAMSVEKPKRQRNKHANKHTNIDDDANKNKNKNNDYSSHINCNSQAQQRQLPDDNSAENAKNFDSHQHEQQQQRAPARHQRNKRKQQRLLQQKQQHHHQHQHQQHQHHYQEKNKNKFKDHPHHNQQQQQHHGEPAMTMLTLPINGAISHTPSDSTSSMTSIYNTTTSIQQTSPSSLGAPNANSSTSLPSIIVVAADRQHLLNRGSIFTTSSLSTASQQASLATSTARQKSLAEQQQQQPPPSAFFEAIAKVPLSSSAVEIPAVAIVGAGSSTSTVLPSSSSSSTLPSTTQPNVDLTFKNWHIDNAPHPVCGTDGRTYNSECQLKKRACRTNNSNLKVAYRGHCRTSCNGVKCLNDLMCVEDQYMTPHCIPCKIQCPQDDDDNYEEHEQEPIVNDYERNYSKKTSQHQRQQQKSYMQRTGIDPNRAVCGVDGKTYKSTCDINRMICKIGRAIAVAYPGPCRADRITCNDINCGSKHKCLVDLLTHEPRCISCGYKCSRKQHQNLHRFENSKICGVNNRTYNSWCEMRKDSCTTGFFIDVKAAGKCH